MHRILGDRRSAPPDVRSDPRQVAGVPETTPPALDTHLSEYLRLLVKRRWTAVIGLALVLALVGLHVYTAVPIYEARVRLLIEQENQTAFSLRDNVAQDRATTDYYHTQYTILQSRSVAKGAIDAIGAWDNPELAGRMGPADLRATGVLEGVMTALASLPAHARAGFGAANANAPGAAPAAPDAGGRPAPGGAGSAAPAGPFETPAQAAVIDAFLARLKVEPIENSRLVDVSFRAATPDFAAEAANAIARVYRDQNLQVRLAQSKQTTDWLAEQLADQRRRIEASELALQQYIERNDAISLTDRQNIVAQRLADLNAMVTRAKADRIERQAAYEHARALQQSGAPLDTLPAVASNPFLQQLRADLAARQSQAGQLAQRLGEKHPEMIKMRLAVAQAEEKLHQAVASHVEALRTEYDKAQALEASLTAALDAQKQEAEALNRKGIDYGVLEREVRTNRQIFDALLERTRETSIVGQLTASEVRIIDPAQVPRAPIWPNRVQAALYGLFFGSLFGIALAFGCEYFKDRIKTPDEIKMRLGLPVLGLVPLARRRRDGEPLLNKGSSPLFAEAFRTVRTRILLSAGERAQSLVVTSTGPGEGKTLVASNLALGLAMTGQRVVLLDVDMRRPRVHDVLGVPRSPGLSDVLAGTIEPRQAIREASSGLAVLPSGDPPNNPTELLSSPRFARLLMTLTAGYDWIVIDSPPVGAVTDACIVANRASAVLFVVAAELTSRAAAMNAVEQLDAAGATFIGAVLNRVKLERDSFYYAPYYRPAYQQYQRPPAAQ